MTENEIRTEFDVMYNNISSGAAPNLNDFERSLFLTRAQDELVRMYYAGTNARYTSFEADEEARRYLDTLITEETTAPEAHGNKGKFKEYSVPKPADAMYILRENAENGSEGCRGGTEVAVNPVRHEDLNRLLANPFKAPNDRKCVRYDTAGAGGSVVFRIVSSCPLSGYTVTYLKKPKAVVLGDLTEFEQDIEGATSWQGHDIPDTLMHKVIRRACELAKSAYTGDLGSTFAVNARDL